MVQVIKRNSKTGTKTKSKPMSWSDASRYYEKASKSIDALDAEGNYKLPHIRISIGKVDA